MKNKLGEMQLLTINKLLEFAGFRYVEKNKDS